MQVRRDAKARQTAREHVKALRANRRAETRYVGDLRGIMRGIHRGYMQILEPHLGPQVRHDGITKHGLDLDKIGPRLITHVKKTVGAAFDRMAGAVDKTNKKAQSLVGIKLLTSSGVATMIATARDTNIRLVENAARAYADQVRDVMDDPENFGTRVEDLADQLQERGDISESRAELIARDQTLKLNGAITKARQTSAGVDSYTWSTSHDDRVRESHAELDGQTFSWDAPPEPGHPGEDFQCRCVPIPVIEGLEDV